MTPEPAGHQARRALRHVPTGTVTFFFTDIEGSTTRWERDRQDMGRALARHNEILRSCIEEHQGTVIKTEGDAFFAVFSTALDGLAAALAAQRALRVETWGPEGEVRVRMALHTGSADEREGDYFGPPVNRVARILSAGHGGQILLSSSTRELVQDVLPEDASLIDLGEHRLKDLSRPEHLFQVVAADLLQDFPALNTFAYHPTNLPIQSTPFVGRNRELAEVTQLLRRGNVRLLTLTGPGGIGKTRLAVQLGSALLHAFRDGVFFCDLSPLTDPALVPSAIGTVLGVREEATRSMLEAISEHLRDKHLLLVLDNCEQVRAAAPAIAQLFDRCRHLSVLATSRVPLHLTREREYPVDPLPVPSPDRLPPLDQLTQYDAVTLFVDRAHAANCGFLLTPVTAPAIVAICHRLDGLPLAIELAAARITLFPLQELLQRLDHRLSLLSRGGRDYPTRHQSLRNTIGWSYSLLQESEQTLFARLSVFAGGCSFEAVEAVCNAAAELDVLEGMTSLVEGGLVRQEGEVEPRFRMLETIREYAVEQLTKRGEEAQVCAAHAAYFAALAEEAKPELTGAEQAIWLQRLDREHDNLRAALRWSVEAKSALGLQLAGALWRFWHVRGHWTEARCWLETVLATGSAAEGDARLRARALQGAGALAWRQGDYERSRAFDEEALRLRRELGDTRGIAASLNDLGNVASSVGDFARAEELYGESLQLRRDLGDRWGIALELGNLGRAALDRGKYDQARALLEESLHLRRELGDQWGTALALVNLGNIALEQGAYERVERLFVDALRIYEELGDAWGRALGLNNLGLLACLQGRCERALCPLEDSLRLSGELGDRRLIAETLVGLAAVSRSRQEPERAARLLGAADTVRASTGAAFDPAVRRLVDGVSDETRVALGAGTYGREWNAGRALALDEAIADALQTAATRPA